MEVLKDMGMTDKQFNGFIRFLIDDLKEAKEEKDTDMYACMLYNYDSYSSIV